jgi:hypothetical protein
VESARLNAHLPPHIRRVQALLAGGAAHQGGLTEEPLELELFARIIDAWDDEMRPLTRREVAERSGLGGEVTFDARFDLLAAYGALIQHRLKAGTIRWTPDPIALISAQILTDLAEESASDRLADLIVLALDRLDAPDLDGVELVAIADRLSRTLGAVTSAIERAVDLGTLADVIEARPSARAQHQVARVSDILRLARSRFDDVTAQLRAPVDAAERFGRATDRLVERLTEQLTTVGAGGLFALLDPAEVDAIARTAPSTRLSTVATDIVFDAARPEVMRAGLVAAADDIGTPPEPRPVPPVPPTSGAADPFELITAQQVRRERRDEGRRRWLVAHLAASDESVLLDDVWPTPVQRLVDALAVAGDPRVPVNADVANEVHVDAQANVAVRAPLRLRRVDVPERASDRREDVGSFDTCGEPAHRKPDQEQKR